MYCSSYFCNSQFLKKNKNKSYVNNMIINNLKVIVLHCPVNNLHKVKFHTFYLLSHNFLIGLRFLRYIYVWLSYIMNIYSSLAHHF